MTIPEKAMSPREAMLSACEEIDVKNSLGRITASAAVTCPPAIPVVVCGEKIDKNAIKLFEYYGVSKIRVVKNNIE
jgi:arginine/lysine/ornithine decarboxylase